MAIGTFANPPGPGQTSRAIIDICGESVIAIAPARLWPQIRAVVRIGSPGQKKPHETSTPGARL